MLKAKIVAVAESSGVRSLELGWESGVQADPRERWSDVAVRAAEMWYAETGQSSEAHVTVRIIGADGAFVDFAVACEPRVVFASRELLTSDGRSGRRVEERRADVAAAVKVIAARCARAALGQMQYPLDRVARDLAAL
jgi:hypothetical protein